MLRNSFKFLSLALAASLTVAPISAIDWNSNSSRWGLAGLAVVTVGFVGVMAYNYFYKSASKQEQKPQEQKQNTEQNTGKMTPERLKKIGGKKIDIDPAELTENPLFTKLTKANKTEK